LQKVLDTTRNAYWLNGCARLWPFEVGIIAATSDEATAVCTALADVVKYFADPDLAFEPVFVLTFRAGPIRDDSSLHPYGS
jgi:hypothetical protein